MIETNEKVHIEKSSKQQVDSVHVEEDKGVEKEKQSEEIFILDDSGDGDSSTDHKTNPTPSVNLQPHPIIIEDDHSSILATSVKLQETPSTINNNRLEPIDIMVPTNDATDNNKKRAASPGPLTLCPGAKRPFLSTTENINLITSEELEAGGKPDLSFNANDDVDHSTQLYSSPDSTKTTREEKPASSDSIESLVKDTVVVIEPLDNFEVMLDDPSTADEISFDGGDVSLPLSATNSTTNKSSGIILRTENPASGANSPFTDSLFNIVAEHDESNEQQLNNDGEGSGKSPAVVVNAFENVQLGEANIQLKLNNDDSSTNMKIINDNGKQSSSLINRQLGTTVYVPMTDDSNTDDDEINNEQANNTTISRASPSDASETRRSSRPRRINISNFF